jgi:hypothetical protein
MRRAGSYLLELSSSDQFYSSGSNENLDSCLKCLYSVTNQFSGIGKVMLKATTFRNRQLNFLPLITCLRTRIDLPRSKIILVYLLQFTCSGKHLRISQLILCHKCCKG